MTQETIFASLKDFSTRHAGLVEELFAISQGARWNLSIQSFTEALRRSAEKRYRGSSANAAEVETYLRSIHLEDLALACACGDGIEAAWEFFVAHFRDDLRTASRAILRTSGSGHDSRAEELADSLYAELYGLRFASGGRGKSLFEYFHGRSKLSTWLRAVLAQRHVDLLRSSRATISLDTGSQDSGVDGTSDGATIKFIAQPRNDAPLEDPNRAMYLAQIDRALSVAFAALTPRERMLLACYYVDERTLAEIGRMVGEHESTISRQLERARRTLRETVTEVLRRGTHAVDGAADGSRNSGMDESQVKLAFEYASEDWPFDLSRALSQADAANLPEE
jgi:RNA polymerase sigma-70 factor